LGIGFHFSGVIKVRLAEKGSRGSEDVEDKDKEDRGGEGDGGDQDLVFMPLRYYIIITALRKVIRKFVS
jgi:hypothetical protein